MTTPSPSRPLSAQAWIALTLVLALAPGASARQQALPPGFGQRVQPAEPAKPEAQQTAPAAQAPAAAPQLPPAATFGGLSLQNVSLAEVIDALARQLKINYILDAKVQGGVTLNTYGEIKDINPRELLDTILRINGAAMVQTGGVHRIVPLADLANMPLQPQLDEKSIPEDDRAMLNLVFLKYADAEELSKLIKEFLGPEGRIWSYTPANLLLLLDSRRSMKRTMELVSLFDSDVLAKQRVKLFDVANGRPSELANELEGLLKSISMGKDLQSIRFVPVDRINVLIAVAPNPGVFAQVEEWIKKLDVRVDNPSGKTDTYVYRVKYGRAETLSMSIMSLFSQMWGMGGMGGMMGGMGGMMGGMGGMGMGGYGMGMGGYGMNPMGGGAMMGNPMGIGGYSPAGMAGGMTGPGQRPGAAGVAGQTGAAAQMGAASAGMGANMTGQFLGANAMMGGMGMGMMGPRVVPNMMDNSLLILATGEEYASIHKLLRQLDVPPRQVLIETKIYEVSLSGALSYGVSAYLRDKAATAAGSRQLLGQLTNTGVNLTFGALIGQSRALFAALSTGEVRDRTRVISAPSIIATDSVPASINVGIEVPVLQSQAVTGVQASGSSLFANTISNRKTGVTLSITPRVNPSGVVTLEVNQEVSAPQAPGTGAIQSPSFSQRTISTQVTVEDGDMIAIGGIISETRGDSSSGVPFLHRLPIVGAAFGGKSSNLSRTELVIFITPRVIYDTSDVAEASDELKSKMRRLQRLMQE
ncbi:MAG: type II secretion system protein GspD [Candidatus Solibacter sp.]|nr:type II secretion system protein GspD [Candidatus Solibacter sp.]